MPTLNHDALVEMFRHAPDLAVTLLARLPRRMRRPRGALILRDASFADLARPERHADLVMEPATGPVCIVEVQLHIDADKRWSWPVYAVCARARHQRPAVVIVIALDEKVARWARKPIPLGAPGCRFTPVVIGPSDIPRLTDLEVGRARPELAVLSAMVHGRSDQAPEIARCALYAAANLDDQRTALYTDLILNAVDAPLRAALEALMNQPYEWQSDFARKYVGIGMQKGLEQGLERGLEQGLETGRLLTLLLALRRVLETRGVPLPDDADAQLRALGGPDALEAALVRAVRADSFADVLKP